MVIYSGLYALFYLFALAVCDECDFLLSPRDTIPGCKSEYALECAWSIDPSRTQTVTKKLTVLTHGNITNLNPAQALDRLTKMYDDSDQALLAVGIVKVELTTDIHIIPMGGEHYFHRSVSDADMVIDGLHRARSLPRHNQNWLDFGGSHGRVAQILAAAYPSSNWFVCDPLQDTITWASKNIPKVTFSVSPQLPSLKQYRNGQFSGVYAISIWSHYAESAALQWFEEMHRILEDGGVLWFTTHGFQAINFGSLDAAVIKPHRQKMFEALYKKGHYFWPMFGTTGDWGSKDGENGNLWGYGAFTTEWLAVKVMNNVKAPWTLVHFGPGANTRHQDVYVLKKKNFKSTL